MRIITQYRLAGTGSFRLASGAWLDEFGVNLQNPDKHTQDIYTAPPGYVIVQADQAGAEAKHVAYLAKPGRYRALFEAGIKPHTYLAFDLFAGQWNYGEYCHADFMALHPSALALHPYWPALNKEVKGADKPYAIGKRTAHGKSYRMGPNTFRDANLKQSGGTLVLSHREAVEFLNGFERLFPEVIQWQDEIEFTIRQRRELRNLFGYPRKFMRQLTDGYIREAISWIPQSTVGVHTHIALNHCRAERPSYRPCSNKHDSYAVMVPEAEAEAAARYLPTTFDRHTFVGRDGVEYKMSSEVQIGRNWKPWHAEKNPAGMKEFKL